MTKKDYVKFAEMFKAQDRWEHNQDTNAFCLHSILISQTADIFQADNPRFNRQRFIEACLKT